MFVAQAKARNAPCPPTPCARHGPCALQDGLSQAKPVAAPTSAQESTSAQECAALTAAYRFSWMRPMPPVHRLGQGVVEPSRQRLSPADRDNHGDK